MSVTRREFLKLLGIGGAGAVLASWLPPAARRLRLLGSSRSVGRAAIAAFEASTGVAVEAHRAIPEILGAPQLDGYDLVACPAHALTALIQGGHVREVGPLPRAALPAGQRAYDPLDAFSVPAARGAVGINARGVPPPASWAGFFELARRWPAHLPPAETFRAALKSLGHSINTRRVDARSQARAMACSLRSAPLAQARLAIGHRLPGWDFALPAEGAELWEDSYCIPAWAGQPALAMEFIRFALQFQPPAAVPDWPVEPLSPFAPGVAA